MHWEIAIIKRDAGAVGDDTGNLQDKKASDAWVCIKAALQRRRDSGRDSRVPRDSLSSKENHPAPPSRCQPWIRLHQGMALPLAGPPFSATICA